MTSVVSSGQDRTYLLAFPRACKDKVAHEHVVMMTASEYTTVNITAPGLDTIRTVDKGQQYKMAFKDDMTTKLGKIKKGVILSTDKPITVQALTQFKYGTPFPKSSVYGESFLVRPMMDEHTSFVIASYR